MPFDPLLVFIELLAGTSRPSALDEPDPLDDFEVEAAEAMRRRRVERRARRKALTGRWRPLATMHGVPDIDPVPAPVRAVLERSSPYGSVIEVTHPMTWNELRVHLATIEVCVCHRWDVFC